MPSDNMELLFDINDMVDLEYMPGSLQIYKIHAVISRIFCEKAKDRAFLVFGEYIFFLLLNSTNRKNHYNVKNIKCPFIKTIEITDEYYDAYRIAPEIHISTKGAPLCEFNHIPSKSSNKSLLYRINLSYTAGVSVTASIVNNHMYEDSGNPSSHINGTSNSGSVKVWRVEGDMSHSIEQLLGIDQDTLRNS